MPDFGIIDPKAAQGEDIPTVTLPDAFLARDSVNVHHRYGRYERIKGRLPVLLDTASAKISAPTDVFAVVTASGSTIVVTGDVLSGNTVLADGATIRLNANSTVANNITYTVSGTPVFGGANSTITIAETLDTADNSGNVFVGSSAILKHHRHVRKGTGTEHLLVANKYHIFLWLQSNMSLTVKFTVGDEGGSSANVERWEIIDHLRNVVATNNSDRVIWWNVDTSTGNNFQVLGQADGIDYEGTANRLTKCKHLASFETYLILGFTTENATVFPQKERWAGRATGGSIIDFDENGVSDAGAKQFTDSPGTLMGFAKHGNDLVIGKQDSVHRSWLITAAEVFQWEEYTLKVGVLSADSFVNDKSGRLYFAASDLTIREINTPQPISTHGDITFKGLNTSQSEFIQATYIDDFEEVWFAFPAAGSDTNNKVLSFHPDSGRVDFHGFPIRSFGDFTQQEAFTYDTLPFSNYNDWGASWIIYDASRNVVGFPLDLASDYNGDTFALHSSSTDDGAAFTGVLIFSTTLTNPKSLNLFKRVNNGVDVIMNRKSSGSVTLYAKRDTEKSWQLLGTASMIDADGAETLFVHVPFDTRFRTAQFKLETTGDLELIGLIFREFDFDGSR